MSALASLLLVTAGVYAHGLHGEFQFDDQHTILGNRNLRHLDRFFHLPPIAEVFRGNRAFTDVTLALNYKMGGLDPFSFHLTNLLIHLAATLLVFFFARKMLTLAGVIGHASLALFAAAVFALHPVQTQAVIYISQRAESLASALYLGGLLLLLRAERRGFSVSFAALYAGSFALFVLGLAAKVTVVTLPLAYLMIGLVPGPSGRDQLARWWKRLALATPFLLLPLYAFNAAAFTGPGLLKGEDAGLSVPALPPWRYFLTEWHVVATYLQLLFWPAGQNLDWDFPLARGADDPIALACGALLCVLLAAATMLLLRCRTRDDETGAAGRIAAFGVFWFFLLLALTSSVIPVVDVLMEHRVYLACWGIFLASAALASIALRGLSRLGRSRVALAASLVLCVPLATATYFRVGMWKSKLALWSDAAAKSPRKARVHLGLGNAYHELGQAQRAVEEYHAGLALAARDPRWIRSDIRGKLAAALLTLGRTEEAIADIQQGLTEDPHDSELLGVLAMAHLRRNELPEAAAAAEQSVRGAREPSASLRVLGLVRTAMGETDKAIAAFETAVQLDPDDEQGRLLLALAYRAQGRVREACDTILSVSRPSSALKEQVEEAAKGCPAL